jgi:hypothetical protein
LLDEEVADGDVTDIIHGEAEGRTLGARKSGHVTDITTMTGFDPEPT